jgi:hypothetical protein
MALYHALFEERAEPAAPEMLPVMPAEASVEVLVRRAGPRTVQTRVSERGLRGRLHLLEVTSITSGPRTPISCTSSTWRPAPRS